MSPKREAPMSSSNLWNLQPSQRATVKRWCHGLIVFSASLGFLALAAVMATGNRLHQTAPAAGLASAGGNLVPLW
jgi:hypothetical protein